MKINEKIKRISYIDSLRERDKVYVKDSWNWLPTVLLWTEEYVKGYRKKRNALVISVRQIYFPRLIWTAFCMSCTFSPVHLSPTVLREIIWQNQFLHIFIPHSLHSSLKEHNEYKQYLYIYKYIFIYNL